MRGALLCAALCGACSTSYTPAASPRLSLVVTGGRPEYVRDGEQFPVGFFGGGLVEATEPVPEAQELAERAQERLTGGFIATLAGSGCLVGSVVASATQEDRDPTVPLMLLGCGVAGLVSGTVFLTKGQLDQMDAINLYNDRVQAQRMPWLMPPGALPPAPGWAPGPSRPTPTKLPPTAPPEPPPAAPAAAPRE